MAICTVCLISSGRIVWNEFVCCRLTKSNRVSCAKRNKTDQIREWSVKWNILWRKCETRKWPKPIIVWSTRPLIVCDHRIGFLLIVINVFVSFYRCQSEQQQQDMIQAMIVALQSAWRMTLGTISSIIIYRSENWPHSRTTSTTIWKCVRWFLW
jgi:hypothetical protein